MKKLLVTAGLLAIAFCANKSFASEAGHHWDNLARIAHDLEKATDVVEASSDKVGGVLEDLGDYNENLADVFDDYMNPMGSIIVEKSVTYLGFIRRGLGKNFDASVAVLLDTGVATRRCADEKIPAAQEPVAQTPTQGEPSQAPTKQVPVQEPVKQTPTQGAPNQAPVSQEPVKQTPTQGAPNQAPVKEVKGCAREVIDLPAEYEQVRSLLNEFDVEYAALLATGKYRP